MDDYRSILDRISEQIGHPLPKLNLDTDARHYLSSKNHSDEEKRIYLTALMEKELAQAKAEFVRLERLKSFEFMRPILGEYATRECMPVVNSLTRLRDPQTASRLLGIEKDSEEFQEILKGDEKLIKDIVFKAIDRGDGKTFRDLGNILEFTPPASATPTVEKWRCFGTVAACYLLHYFVTHERLPTKRLLRDAVEKAAGEDFSNSAWSRLLMELKLTDVLPHHSSATHRVVKVRKASSKKRGESWNT